MCTSYQFLEEEDYEEVEEQEGGYVGEVGEEAERKEKEESRKQGEKERRTTGRKQIASSYLFLWRFFLASAVIAIVDAAKAG